MICRIQGVLESVEGGVAVLQAGPLAYEVLVSAYTAGRLGGLIGQTVTFHTLHYLEGQNQGATMYPRLAGFLSPADREFFELFTTTKGIGNKRGLRAMALSSDQIAAAIADRDLATLQSLPEVGRRTAETIVATLHGKVDRFVSAAAYGAAGAGAGAPAAGAGPGAEPGARGIAREALEVLMQLGENRTQAIIWIDEALRTAGDDKPKGVEDLIQRVYRIKSNA